MATPSVAQVPTVSNWITAGSLYDYKKPQNDPKMIRAFGSQDITGLMDMIGGGKNPVSGILFRHFEEDRLDTIVTATGTAGASGIAVVYTLSSTYEVTGFPSAFDPYISASYPSSSVGQTQGTTTLNPVRVGQDVTFSNGVKGTVTAVTSTTFTVAPDKLGAGATAVCPTQTGVENIVLGSIVNGESGDQPKAMNFRLNAITGVLQIINETASSSGTALGEEVWIDNFTNENGETGSVWFFKNQLDARKRLLNHREIDCVSGQEVTNTTDLATYSPSLLKTRGLFTFAQSYSGVTNYNISAGVSLNDFDNLIIDSIDKNKGADENSVWCSIRLRQSIDAFIRPEMQAGAVQYGAFGGGANNLDAKQSYINFGFNGIEHLGKTFHFKTYQVLNNPTMLGAIKQYQNMGVVIPMDTSTERIGDMKEKIEVPALRMNYLAKRKVIGDVEEWLTGGTGGIYNTTLDTINYNLRTQFGFEGFRPNAYAFLQGS